MKKIYEHEVLEILTGKISSTINRSLLRAFAAGGLNISTEQWSVLAVLWEKDKVTQQTICDLTRKDKPSMTRLIDNLEKRNLVVRVSDPSDRRINLIHLTDEGANMQVKANEIVQSVITKALVGIDDDALNEARQLLLHIMDNLDA